LIAGNPNPNTPRRGARPGSPGDAGNPAGPAVSPPARGEAPVDEEAHFRLDEHQRQIDEIKQGDMKALVRALGELVAAIRELVATREV
jgi:hypothetical protein